MKRISGTSMRFWKFLQDLKGAQTKKEKIKTHLGLYWELLMGMTILTVIGVVAICFCYAIIQAMVEMSAFILFGGALLATAIIYVGSFLSFRKHLENGDFEKLDNQNEYWKKHFIGQEIQAQGEVEPEDVVSVSKGNETFH